MFCRCEGVILFYSLIRDDVEIFRHSSAVSYRDSNVIVPYQSYDYQLRACNSAGCVTTPAVNCYLVFVLQNGSGTSLICATLIPLRQTDSCLVYLFNFYASEPHSVEGGINVFLQFVSATVHAYQNIVNTMF